MGQSDAPNACALLRDASAGLRFDDRDSAVFATRQLLLWMLPRPDALSLHAAQHHEAAGVPDNAEVWTPSWEPHLYSIGAPGFSAGWTGTAILQW